MDTASSPHQILDQFFGHPSTDEQRLHQQQQGGNGTFPIIPTGGRNQYMELERFDTEEQFQCWLQAQGRKWGIVQKGRVTIEDIIDQYACVFRRRKGYACRVQMRVRHNRRSGHKVVEVLPIAHDHTFYGATLPAEVDEGMLNTVPTSVAVKAFASSLGSSLSAPNLELPVGIGQGTDCDGQFGTAGNNTFLDFKQGFADISSFLEQTGAELGDGGGGGEEPNESHLQHQQPMETLWSNILNNPAIQQFANGDLAAEMKNVGICFGGVEEQQQDERDADELGLGEEQREQQLMSEGGGEDGQDEEGQMLIDQADLLANCVTEKLMAHMAHHFEPKFASILMALEKLTKNVDELKRQMIVQQQRQQKPLQTMPEIRQPFLKKSANNKTDSPGIRGGNQLPATLQAFIQKKKAEKQWQQKKEQQSQEQSPPKHQLVPVPFAPSPSSSTQNQSITAVQQSTVNSRQHQQLPTPITNTPLISNNCKNMKEQQELARGADKSQFTMRSNSMVKTAGRHFGMGGFVLHSPMKTSRKSVHAYRQRRRELSYRFMKEVGMSLTINGTTKSIFHWRAADINAACQAKRKELIETGKPVVYRGNDITSMLYRVDCSRDLVNGRRCGQMIADSLWPQGYFQTRMLMPILKGVSHRSKKRVDGSARRPVANDQFEIFKVALLLLGGFLMDESDRSKWMETAREGVNQRGLDELANSKRAHYEYEGGPLFAQNGYESEEEEIDEEEEADEGEEDADEGEEDTAMGMDADDNNQMSADGDDMLKQHQSAMRIAEYLATLPVNLDFLRGVEQKNDVMFVDNQIPSLCDGNEQQLEEEDQEREFENERTLKDEQMEEHGTAKDTN